MRSVGLAIAPVLLLAACGGGTGGGVPAPARSGVSPASSGGPVIVDEATVERAVHAGEPTVLLFMATGCSSCAAQASALAAAAAGRSVQLVGVDLVPEDDPTVLRAFLSDAQLSSLPITWTIDKDQSLDRVYQVQTLDETVGLAGGAVRFHNTAAVDATQLGRQIAALT